MSVALSPSLFLLFSSNLLQRGLQLHHFIETALIKVTNHLFITLSFWKSFVKSVPRTQHAVAFLLSPWWLPLRLTRLLLLYHLTCVQGLSPWNASLPLSSLYLSHSASWLSKTTYQHVGDSQILRSTPEWTLDSYNCPLDIFIFILKRQLKLTCLKGISSSSPKKTPVPTIPSNLIAGNSLLPFAQNHLWLISFLLFPVCTSQRLYF